MQWRSYSSVQHHIAPVSGSLQDDELVGRMVPYVGEVIRIAVHKTNAEK